MQNNIITQKYEMPATKPSHEVDKRVAEWKKAGWTRYSGALKNLPKNKWVRYETKRDPKQVKAVAGGLLIANQVDKKNFILKNLRSGVSWWVVVW
mmetsp:Transcript_2733/g.10502  ORF Transcript_2733/g.10502 Transcript_2733/m.10502 type:complete len:95 (-) Transcript_2733:3-287(-)